MRDKGHGLEESANSGAVGDEDGEGEDDHDSEGLQIAKGTALSSQIPDPNERSSKRRKVVIS
jgi:hypothetical protein